MSKTVIAIDPVTRLEGHLKVECRWRTAKSPTHGSPAACSGVRGHPARAESRDASQIVQRICGVCPGRPTQRRHPCD